MLDPRVEGRDRGPDQLLAEADLALEARDLAGYQENVEAAKALIDQALQLLDAGGG